MQRPISLLSIASVLLNPSCFIMADPALKAIRSTVTQPPDPEATDLLWVGLQDEFTFAYPASLLPHLPLRLLSERDPALVHARSPFPAFDTGLVAQLPKRDEAGEDSDSTGSDSTLHSLTKRACNVGDVTCQDNFCCQPGHTCTVRNGKHVCLRRGNRSASPDPAYKVPPSNDGGSEGTSGGSSLSGGAIAGIVIGAVAVVCGLIAIAIIFFRRHRTRGQQQGARREDMDEAGGGEPRIDNNNLTDMYGGSNVGVDSSPVELGGEEMKPLNPLGKAEQPLTIDTKLSQKGSTRGVTPKVETARVEAAGDEPLHPGSTTAARAELPA
ncbi:MAG: hypothetical protein M1831_004603 [Alyxoria varia]|nr:MAG: hypothetical protein M1831_004603 [Alyxoria varia]